MWKIIAIILMIAVVIFIVRKGLSKIPAVMDNYTDKVKTGGEIEKKYLKNGSYNVSYHEDALLQDFKKFDIYYPTELQKEDRKWPVIVLCNGTGMPLSKYSAVARHYASWGFIVIGTEEEYSWNAFGAEMSIRYLERMNENKQVGDRESIFFKKVDLDNVGIVGHSQGGVGVINAATNTENADIYKTAVALSPTNAELAHTLFWDYDAEKVSIPIMLISAAGDGDKVVVTDEQLNEIYDEIPSDKVKVRRKDVVHGQTLYSEDGYVTAWFMWQLQGDEDAAKAFTGDSPEIMSNDLYQDKQISIGEEK